MSAITIGFEERLEEVEAYISFLIAIEQRAQHGPPRLEGAEQSITTQQQRILYSSVYLHLYNLVEATMTGCIDAVARAAVETGSWYPADLSDSLLREWVRNIARTHKNLTSENRLKSALDLCNQVVQLLPLSTFSIEKGGGGNWDDLSIEAITGRLGCALHVSAPVYRAVKRPFRDELGPLGVVKKLRNNLAHGSISFAQCAEDITVTRLIELKEATANYLREVIVCFNDFINGSQFLRPERRPA